MTIRALLVGLPLVLGPLAGPARAEGAPPPLPDASVPRYHYAGSGGQGLHTVEEVAAFVARDRGGTHLLWMAGWPAWRPWTEVPDVLRAVPPPMPEAPMVPGVTRPPTTWLYAGPDGRTRELDTAAVADRILGAPEAAHLVWKPGMRSWSRAGEMEEIRRAVAEVTAAAAAAPPPLPPAPIPPPLPGSPPGTAGPPSPDARPGASPAPGAPAWEGGGPRGSGGAAVGGEVWFGLRLDGSTGTDAEDGAPLGATFQVQHARLHGEAALDRRLSARLGLDAVQPGLDDTFVARLQDRSDDRDDLSFQGVALSAPEGWILALEDAWIDVGFGARDSRVRAGLQAPILGSTDWFDRFDAFFLGGAHAWASLPWRSGRVPARDLGIQVHVVPASGWALEAQVLNGSTTPDPDADPGKEVLGRVTYAPSEALRCQASGQYGIRGDEGEDHSDQFDLAIEARFGHARFMAEGLLGTDTVGGIATQFAGAQAAGAVDLPLRAEALDHATLVARGAAFDPRLEPDAEAPWPDTWYALDAAVQLHWHTAPGRTFLTGLVYEAFLPSNDRLPVGHEGVLQAVWAF